MQYPVDDLIKLHLNDKLSELEKYLKGDVISFYGPIHDGLASNLRKLIIELQAETEQKNLFFVLTTTGGSAIEVERIVNVIRRYYDKVSFIVPDYAYSAGTILCMSGDKIYMDYFGVLGPIDPQVLNRDSKFIPAQGYLDKVEELIEKSKKPNQLSEAEYLMLNKLDLADLRAYEQARELTIDLLKKWLVKYKFKNWERHSSNNELVRQEEKESRAAEIAKKLSDNGIWKTHARGINIDSLRDELKLRIENYENEVNLSRLIGEYYSLKMDYIRKNAAMVYFHTRRFI